MSEIFARYRLHGQTGDARKKAEQIAVGQTTGIEASSPHRGRVVSVAEKGSGVVETEIAFPVANVGDDLGALVTMCFGKVSMDGAIRWIGLRVPEGWPREGGPALGVTGLRTRFAWPEGRPPLMGILKPCLGLSPEALAELFLGAARGGADIVKDDEVLAGEAQEGDGPLRRIAACRSAAERARSATGKLCRYAVHLSGPADTLLDRAEQLVRAGAECLLVNVFVYGLPWLHALRRRLGGKVALMAHPAFSGAITGSATHGVDEALLLGTLVRLAGADLGLFPSPYGTVALPKEVALAVAHEQTRAQGGLARTLPVPSAGIKASMVREIVQDFGKDVVVNAGTAIFAHPDGAEAGARSFVLAIDAACGGEAARR